MKTIKASLKHSQNADVRKAEKKEEIRKIVFEDFCECGQCASGDYSNLCISNKSLAGYCNTLGIKTLSGIGKWQTTSVGRLFPKPRTLEEFF
jgi:hypothetical protein